ncbi:MAG: hypothetical protein KAJ19_29340, partial [Gammaproteobacteria bacterium]|nr:hypothetical protein [Gammaproteobacteria bacterium]
IDLTSQIITVDINATESQATESIIHEMLHGIIYHHTGIINHDETVISAIASGLYQMGFGKLLNGGMSPPDINQ